MDSLAVALLVRQFVKTQHTDLVHARALDIGLRHFDDDPPLEHVGSPSATGSGLGEFSCDHGHAGVPRLFLGCSSNRWGSDLILSWVNESIHYQSFNQRVLMQFRTEGTASNLPVGMFPGRLLGFGVAWVGVAAIGIQPICPARGCACTLCYPAGSQVPVHGA